MIEWMNWTQASKSIGFFVALLISLLGVAINFYIAISKHFFIMVKALSNCKWFNGQVRSWDVTSYRSRNDLVTTVCAAMINPGFGIRRGLINSKDIQDFPKYLKRWLRISFLLMISGASWCVMQEILTS